MKLGKPPIVEVSVEFFFEGSTADAEWTQDRATAFADQFKESYPESEYSAEHFVEVVSRVPGKKPTLIPRVIPKAFRSFPPDRSRYLLTTRDSLRCTFCRTVENDYKGFVALKTEAVDKLAAYVEFFRPTRMIGLAIEYVDFFRIPTVNGKAALRDFFTICDEPAEDVFGTTLSVRKGFTTRLPETGDFLTCQLFNVPKKAEPDQPGIFFKMEWRLFASNDVSWEPVLLRKRIDAAHRHMLSCFRASFTRTGWSLFDENKGNDQ